MFAPFCVALSEGSHEVRVKIYPNPPEERPIVIPPTFGIKNNVRFSMSYGWDFAPRIIILGI